MGVLINAHHTHFPVPLQNGTGNFEPHPLHACAYHLLIGAPHVNIRFWSVLSVGWSYLLAAVAEVWWCSHGSQSGDEREAVRVSHGEPDRRDGISSEQSSKIRPPGRQVTHVRCSKNKLLPYSEEAREHLYPFPECIIQSSEACAGSSAAVSGGEWRSHKG